MKKGFTLVELLAVIVILAVILAIAIPNISSIVDSTKKSSLESSTKIILKSIELEIQENSSFDPSGVNQTNIASTLNVDNSNYQTVTTSVVDSKLYIVIIGQNKWAGFKACGTRENIKVVDINDESCNDIELLIAGYDSTKDVNMPKLASGMTPIKWSGTAWVDTTENDSDWYNYTTTDKKWANARTADGSMWVWIPRYIYKISTGWHSNTTGTIDVQFSKGTNDNWNSSSIGNIDTGTSSNASNNKWTNHPAFTFGSAELAGIWVAKFEATAAEGVANGYTSDQSCPIAGDNVATKAVKIIPNAMSWRCITIGNAFAAARNMETKSSYGWALASGLQTTGTFTTDNNGIDTHLIKNTEWGAVAYLSKSQYGKNDEVWINNGSRYTTGCAGNTVSAGLYSGCQNTYESTNGLQASTTGNIYGIYDMAGGTPEYSSAYLNNGNGDLLQGSRVTGAIAQYKDVYTVGATDDQASNYALAINQRGDSLYETSNNINGSYSWFGDGSNMPVTTNPWFLRGGGYGWGTGSGVFSFVNYWGGSGSSYGFRPVLLVNAQL